MERYSHAIQTLGHLYHEFRLLRVLIVGVGGVGSELLKNVVMLGFSEIVLIDLDIIETSNLNRQFLFRSEHVGAPKAVTACNAAKQFNPDARIFAYHSDIRDCFFDIEWFRSFSVVFNALDNIEARRHVNKICLAANIPLIESGTTGFNGQVQIIRYGITECYECNPKPAPKSFPVCTIRINPTKFVHCVIWAKNYLFQELFGVCGPDETSLDTPQAYNALTDFSGKSSKPFETLRQLRNSIGSKTFVEDVFNTAFYKEVCNLQEFDMWKSGGNLQPLKFSDFLFEIEQIDTSSVSQSNRNIWSIKESAAVFFKSLSRLSDRVTAAWRSTSNRPGMNIINFDKDDNDVLNFVVASSNLRAVNFGLPLTLTKFEIKQLTGNIIPAIATTNAMAASLSALQSIRVLLQNVDSAKMLFLSHSFDHAISLEDSNLPNPYCIACSPSYAQLWYDESFTTLKHLVVNILFEQLKCSSEISVSVMDNILYDIDLQDNLPRLLSSLGVSRGVFITIVDDLTKTKICLIARPRPFRNSELPLRLQDINVSGFVKESPSPTELEFQSGHVTYGQFVNSKLNNLKRKRDTFECPSSSKSSDTVSISRISNKHHWNTNNNAIYGNKSGRKFSISKRHLANIYRNRLHKSYPPASLPSKIDVFNSEHGDVCEEFLTLDDDISSIDFTIVLDLNNSIILASDSDD